MSEYKKIKDVKFYYFIDKRTNKPIGAVGIDKEDKVYCRSTLYPDGVTKISQIAAEQFISGVWNMTDENDNNEYFESRWLYNEIKKLDERSRFLTAIKNMENAVRYQHQHNS